MKSESDQLRFSKIKDLEHAKSEQKFNLHVKLVTVTTTKISLLQGSNTVGVVADQTGCINVQFKKFDAALVKQDSYLTLLDCQFPKNIDLENVKLEVSKFSQISEKLIPKSINLNHNVTLKIKENLQKNSEEDIPIRINKLEAECEMLKKKIPNVDQNQRKKIRSQMIEIQNQLNRLRQQYLMENYEEESASYQIAPQSEPYSFQIPSKHESPRDSLFCLREEMKKKSSEEQKEKTQIKQTKEQPQAKKPEEKTQVQPNLQDKKVESKLQFQNKPISDNKSNLQRLIQDSHLFYIMQAKCETINGRQTIKNYVKLYSELKQKGSQQNSDKFNLEKVDVESVWDIIQKAAEKRPQICHIICQEVMNRPISQQSIKESEEMKKKFAERAQAQPVSFANTICVLIQLLEKAGVPVILSEKSTVQSKISLRALTGEFMENAIKVREKIEDNDPDCPYKFDDLYDSKKFEDFCAYYKKRVSKETGLNPEKIYISSVAKGSIRVEYFTDDTETFSSSMEASPVLRKKLKLHKFFEYLHLSPQDFDPRGNIEFFSSKDYIQTRGGWPYYQPIGCKRYGINVLKKYDNGDDTWLMMNDQPKEWAVAFHGVKAPLSFVTSGAAVQKTVIQSIMGGLQNKSMLKEGYRQAYEDQFAVNKPSKTVGKGIYCTPYVKQTFQYTNPTAIKNQKTSTEGVNSQAASVENQQATQINNTNNSQQYHLIFQCRVNPKQIKICSTFQQYWVLNHTKDIRPYGIILMKQKIKEQYPNPNQFGNFFKYADFKQSIEKYTSSY